MVSSNCNHHEIKKRSKIMLDFSHLSQNIFISYKSFFDLFIYNSETPLILNGHQNYIKHLIKLKKNSQMEHSVWLYQTPKNPFIFSVTPPTMALELHYSKKNLEKWNWYLQILVYFHLLKLDSQQFFVNVQQSFMNSLRMNSLSKDQSTQLFYALIINQSSFFSRRKTNPITGFINFN